MSRSSRENSSPVSLFSFQDIITSLSGIMILMTLILAVDLVANNGRASKETLDPLNKDRRSELTEKRNTLVALELAIKTNSNNIAKENPASSIMMAEKKVEAEEAHEGLIKKNIEYHGKVEETREQLAELIAIRDKKKKEKEALLEQVARLQRQLATIIEEKKIFFIPGAGSSKTPYLVECSGNMLRVGRIHINDRPKRIEGFVSEDMQKEFLDFAQGCSTSASYFIFMIKPSANNYVMSLINKVRDLGFDVGYDALEEENSIGYEKL